MPVILSPDGKKKLSKRDGAKDILAYREEGYLPEAMMNFLALLGWNPGTDQEYFSKEELIQAFELDRIQVSGAGFNEKKLLSVNQYWMRKLSTEEFILRGNLTAPDTEKLHMAVPLLKDRAHTFKEAREMLSGELSCLFTDPAMTKDILLAKELPGSQGMTKNALKTLSEAIKSLPEGLSHESVKEVLMLIADAEESKGKGGRGAVLWPLRYALSGQERSPDPFTLISILGKEESVSRVLKAIGILEG